MATYSTSDAIYGTGIFGTARFGRVTPVISVTGVFGTGQIEPPEIGGFEVDIGVRLTATTLGTGSVGSIPAFQVHVGAGLTGVTATVSIGQISISSIQTLSSVVGTGFAGVSTDEIEAAALLLEEDSIEFAATLAADIGVGISVIPTGVAATGQVQDITTVHVGAGLVTVTGTGVMGEVTPTAVVFDFAAVKEQYSKRRSVFVQRAA
jgi:hypothetical protein